MGTEMTVFVGRRGRTQGRSWAVTGAGLAEEERVKGRGLWEN